ncbi:hypothetical protein ZWY2020_042583 [Hordeum vulgare]|nr:hypothetical protein ZWY2020_042583 [Hordeum vulgare]
MLASKPKASLPEPSNHKEPANSSSGSNYSRAHASAPRVSRLAKPAATAGSSKQAAEARAPSPLHNAARAAAAAPLDKSVDAAQKPSPGERRSNFKASPHRTSATPDRQPRVAKASELQAQLNLVQEDLRNAREHLANIDRDRAQVHGDLVLTKTLADEAYQKLEESLAAQRRAEEALELERFKSVEREQASMELARRKEEEWQRKHADITKRHAQDVNSLAKATKELENAMGELAVTAQAKNSALSRADEAEKTTQGIAKRMEILMAEVTRLKSEMESREKGAEEIIDKLRSEATELRAELQRAMAFQEKLVRAEEVVEGLKVDIAYAKRAEMDADQSAQGWKNKAAALNDRLVAITSLNKSNEEALASLTKSFQEAQSQLLQLTEKAAASECEASQYKEGFLETNRRLDIVRKEASDLQAAIDSLRSEHELLNEAHRQVVSNEKAASSQISILGGDKVRLQQELDEAREEKNKAKKGVEDVAAALRQVSAEAREAKERVLAKQTELDHAQLQISELKTTTKNAGDKHQLMLHESNCLKEKVEMLESEAKNAKENYELILDESNHLKKTVERLGSEAKILQDDRVSKEVRFAEMLRRSEEEASYVRSEMSKLMESLAAAETELQKLKAEKTQLVHQLEEGSERTAMDAPSSKATARKAGEEEEDRSADKSNALLVKLEMDTMLQSQRAAENEAKDAKDNMAQLQSKLRLVESKITEANLTAEEEKISSLRLKETLTEKEEELQSIVRENDSLRTREAAARAKADELAAMLAEATAMKGGDQSAGRSPEKQPNVFRKMMCSPMDNVARGDHEARRNSDRIVQVLEEIKHVEVETVRQVKHEREVSVEANSMENSKIIEDDLCKGMMSNGVDTESSDDDDIDSQGEDGAADQMGGLLTHGPRSSFKQEHHSHKKKKALLRKFGSMLKKKAHFTKLNKHS